MAFCAFFLSCWYFYNTYKRNSIRNYYYILVFRPSIRILCSTVASLDIKCGWFKPALICTDCQINACSFPQSLIYEQMEQLMLCWCLWVIGVCIHIYICVCVCVDTALLQGDRWACQKGRAAACGDDLLLQPSLLCLRIPHQILQMGLLWRRHSERGEETHVSDELITWLIKLINGILLMN